MRALRLRRACATALVLSIASPAVAAPTKTACLDAHEEGQVSKKEGKLRAAREKLLVCAADACPGLVKVDCANWLVEIERDQPTVIVRASEEGGDAVADVRVVVDGLEVAKYLDGKPIALDPGVHAFRFERAGGKAVERQVLATAGEKNALVEVTFPKEAEAPLPAPKKPIVPLVVASAGVVAIGVGAWLGLSARARLDELRDTCAPHCDPAERSTLERKLSFGDLAMGAGVIAIGVAGYLFFARGPREGKTTAAIAPLPGGGAATLRVTF